MTDRYLKVVLTVIAACLLWLCLWGAAPNWGLPAEAAPALGPTNPYGISAYPDFVSSGGTTQLTGPTQVNYIFEAVVAWEWSDDAGGTFLPSIYAQNPTWTAPANPSEEMMLVRISAAVSPDGETFYDQANILLGVLPQGQHFYDVPLDHWACPYIEACYDAGLVQGYGNGYYQPDATVTRDEMAVYIARVAGLAVE